MQFIIGFLIGLLVSLPLMVFFKKKRDRKDSFHDQTEKIQEINKMAGMLAHELKNPLSTIKINLKLIVENLDDIKEPGQQREREISRARRKLDLIHQETDRLQYILDGYLKYFDKTELDLVKHDINEIVSDVVDFYMPQCFSRNVTLRQSFHDKPLSCNVDAYMLKQVILNLFINSMDAMDGGGELMVKTDRQDGRAVIMVSDTGAGMSAEKISRIFDLYYSSKVGGFGLGLPTAKKIVEAHGGTIDVKSETEKGSCFIIKLPLLQ